MEEITMNEDERLLKSVRRINGNILGLALGAMSGFTLFIATLWLVIKGGENVGVHLNLLNNFLIGYSVTYTGSIIGLLYGFVIGFGAGWFIAWVYDFVVALRHGTAGVKS